MGLTVGAMFGGSFQLGTGGNPFTAGVAASRGAMNASIARAKKVQDGIAESAKALGILKPEIQMRILRPDQHSKASRILIRMEAAGYSHEQINHVVKALVAFRDEEMR